MGENSNIEKRTISLYVVVPESKGSSSTSRAYLLVWKNLLESLKKVRHKMWFHSENESLNTDCTWNNTAVREWQFQCTIMTQCFQTHLFKTLTHLTSLTCETIQKNVRRRFHCIHTQARIELSMLFVLLGDFNVSITHSSRVWKETSVLH